MTRTPLKQRQMEEIKRKLQAQADALAAARRAAEEAEVTATNGSQAGAPARRRRRLPRGQWIALGIICVVIAGTVLYLANQYFKYNPGISRAVDPGATLQMIEGMQQSRRLPDGTVLPTLLPGLMATSNTLAQ